MLTAMLNGKIVEPQNAVIPVDDRGLLYGDGLFETMLLRHGRVRFVDDHLQRLIDGCTRLNIDSPDIALMRRELEQLIASHRNGIVKLLLTRGRGGRGYRVPMDSQPTRAWQVFAFVAQEKNELSVCWCNTRLARNSLLAGMKHLNRLEQVMAQSEWNDSHIDEGLLTDTEGELICGTMSNVFLVIEGTLVTPDLRYCGVAGVMRKNVLRIAHELSIAAEVRAVRPEELYSASEVFVTNAVRGIRSVASMLPVQSDAQPRDAHQWTSNDIAMQITRGLEELSQNVNY